MANFEKEKSKTQEAPDNNKLYKEVVGKDPLYTSKAEALENFNLELQSLAIKHHLSIEALLVKAETSSKFDEDYIQALSLARRIAHFKK